MSELMAADANETKNLTLGEIMAQLRKRREYHQEQIAAIDEQLEHVHAVVRMAGNGGTIAKVKPAVVGWRFSCESCGQKFKGEGWLKRHMRSCEADEELPSGEPPELTADDIVGMTLSEALCVYGKTKQGYVRSANAVAKLTDLGFFTDGKPYKIHIGMVNTVLLKNPLLFKLHDAGFALFKLHDAGFASLVQP